MSMRRTLAVGAAVAGVIALAAGGGAIAASTIGTGDIRDGAVRSPDIHDGGVHAPDLADKLENRVNVGRITRLEADGPYPGATDLGGLDGQGDNSSDLWTNDGARQTSWVKCARDKVALGGGYNLAADAGDAKAKQVQVVVSEPTYVKGGELADGTIQGDDAMSIRPNAWLVQGFYTGEGSVVVRPWVVCAKVS
jgi:hypothetical protein